MTYITKPKVTHPESAKNSLGLTRRDYEGGLSTLCAGCGHDSITAAIVQAFFEMAIPPHTVAKMSGIGCSSKTPGYFLAQAHGFNSVHGRMPSVATGAYAASSGLHYIGVSGDGDTGSIGLGQFMHCIRRNINMLYIIENNGVYGLTKGQFSALADRGSASKGGEKNQFTGIDPLVLAIQLGGGFVGRGFSGDKSQLVPLIKAGLSYPGFALLDVISPCVTFANHPSSTRSYDYTRDHYEEINIVDIVAARPEITLDLEDGGSQVVELHDGTFLHIKKIDKSYDLNAPLKAIQTIETHRAEGKIATGLLYLNRDKADFHKLINTTTTPLRDIPLQDLCPGPKALDVVQQGWR